MTEYFRELITADLAKQEEKKPLDDHINIYSLVAKCDLKIMNISKTMCVKVYNSVK